MAPELLASTAGIILSLAMNYVPGISTYFAGLTPTSKRLVMAILVVVSAVASAFWACDQLSVACIADTDWKVYVKAIVAALVANQATHQITPKSVEARKS